MFTLVDPNVHTEEEDKDILALAAENGGEILEMLLKNGSITYVIIC